MIIDEIRRPQAEATNTGAVVEEVELVRSTVAAPAAQIVKPVEETGWCLVIMFDACLTPAQCLLNACSIPNNRYSISTPSHTPSSIKFLGYPKTSKTDRIGQKSEMRDEIGKEETRR